jgi:hypothetical protein
LCSSLCAMIKGTQNKRPATRVRKKRPDTKKTRTGPGMLQCLFRGCIGRPFRLPWTSADNLANFSLLNLNPDFFGASAGQHKRQCSCLFSGGGWPFSFSPFLSPGHFSRGIFGFQSTKTWGPSRKTLKIGPPLAQSGLYASPS